MRPDWLKPVIDGAAAITARELTRFVPPAGFNGRQGAVLMLFGEGPQGPDVLLTERAHHMRSHPGQVSFPGGGLDPGDASPQAADGVTYAHSATVRWIASNASVSCPSARML